jgi:hypothetical protein
MWKDVVIGEGPHIVTARHVSEIEGEHRISQNSNSFWIGGLLCDLGMTIFRDTAEGTKLTLMIRERRSLEEILDFLNMTLVQHVDQEILVAAIERSKNDAFREGYRTAQKDIRKALGVQFVGGEK